MVNPYVRNHVKPRETTVKPSFFNIFLLHSSRNKPRKKPSAQVQSQKADEEDGDFGSDLADPEVNSTLEAEEARDGDRWGKSSERVFSGEMWVPWYRWIFRIYRIYGIYRIYMIYIICRIYRIYRI